MALAACYGPLWAQKSPGEVIREIGFDQKLDAQVPLNLAFRDESGRPVQLKDYFGEKPVVLSLVYYDCPMLCTMVLNGQTKALRALKLDPNSEFTLVTVSFDPKETPQLAAEKKKVYIRQYNRAGAEQGWHFLTGDEESIRRLTDAVGFRYLYDPETKQFAHASGIIVLTPDGKVSRYFYGIEYSARDLRLGLIEASAGRIGTLADQVLLLCYHYDPATGKYGAVILGVIRVLGTATVVILVGFMLVMLRRERRGLLHAQAHRT